MKSLVIYLPSLGGGGVERLRLFMAPLFMQAGYSVTFLLHTATGELIDSVPPGVRVVSLDCNRTLAALLPMIRFLKKEKPDVLLSSLGHNNIMAIWATALARTRNRVIVTQHNALSAEKVKGNDLQFMLLPWASRIFLRFADEIIAVSKGVADDMAKVAHLNRDRVTVIYNPVVFSSFNQSMNEPVQHRWLTEGGPPVIIGVGRFVDQKDFATLVSAFALLTKSKDARLILLGDGPLRKELTAQAQKLGVADRVDMPGFFKNPLPFMRHAKVLALSSKFEGFGNVLVEALACGTQVVSTDCTFGPSEILDNQKYGHLVPVNDPEALAKALIQAIDAPISPQILQDRGNEFTVERAAKQYLALFSKA